MLCPPNYAAGEGQGEGVITTYYLYSDEGLIGEYDSTGAEIKAYGYKPNSTWSTDPLFMKQGADYFFYHNDHLGTPQKMTNISGAIVWSATYDAFGKATIDGASTVTNNLRFPGQYFDAETELHYNGSRFYDPGTRRYMTTDPLGCKNGDKSLYLYAKNSPLNQKDPLGLRPVEEWPRYGNWCGKNWSGGCDSTGGIKCYADPIDDTDACCAFHDYCTDKCEKKCKDICDKENREKCEKDCKKDNNCDKNLCSCINNAKNKKSWFAWRNIQAEFCENRPRQQQ